MAIESNTLLEESKCYLCLGVTQFEALQLALLNRIASGSSGDGSAVYRALLTQTGTNAPTAIVLENSLGFTPTFSYVGVGQYTINGVGQFTVNKTYVNLGDNGAAVQNPTLNSIGLFSFDITGAALADDIYRNMAIEIRIYP